MARSTRRLSWRAGIATAIAALVTALVPAMGAEAATDVNVRPGVCSDAYAIQTGAGFAGGVNFVLGSHQPMTLTLSARNSWGWKKAANGQNLPLQWKNQYHVRFLDAAGRTVWTEYNAIPNGGSRAFQVGSNVRTIQVSAGTGVNSYGYPLRPAVEAGVGYAS